MRLQNNKKGKPLENWEASLILKINSKKYKKYFLN